ncbi:alpha/beta hydrolase [Nocardia sp. alder85J]|uniref:alpha/beta hydrolase n=1 Tax=Nocardia sp. alder85J TaxID=2862949 RepID=UPI001CD3057E|nr:alpha/beta hydrolase [Nocardia sp. alder85J]MCX4093968.1 alpha/beta hydrolase [Nocardia sp. alder85J]
MSDHLTIPDVLGWNPEALTEQAREWHRQATTLGHILDDRNRAVDSSHEFFQGSGGDTARTRFTEVRDRARKVLEALRLGSDAAGIASMNFASAKGLVERRKHSAEAKGLHIDDDGTCHLTESTRVALYLAVGGNRDKYTTALAALQTDCDDETTVLRKVLDNAALVDTNAVTAIAAAFETVPPPDSFGNATTPAVQPTPRPENATPERIRHWWDALTPQQQQREIDTHPADIGNLDGLPATVRDRANRTMIPLEHDRLTTELEVADAALTTDPSDLNAVRRSTDLRKRLADLDAVDQATRDHPEAKLLLLDLKTGRQGRAALAFGDPDTADHIAVTTPGMSTNLRDSLNSKVTEAIALKRQAERQSTTAQQDRSIATIAWLGYDPPQMDIGDIGMAGNQSRAEEGGRLLARFYDGLDVAGTKNEPHITALGHSYGSLTTSLALQQAHGRGVDNAVFYGSPGLGGRVPNIESPIGAHFPFDLGRFNDSVQSAADLGLPPGHVFEMTNRADPIATLGSFGRSPDSIRWITHLATSAITVDGITYTEGTGHSAYPDMSHRSGYNLAAVVAGLPDNAIHPGR